MGLDRLVNGGRLVGGLEHQPQPVFDWLFPFVSDGKFFFWFYFDAMIVI